MRLVLTSDTHGLFDKVTVPDGDVLIHCGDITSSGALSELARFNDQMAKLPHKHKLVIAGNHDTMLQKKPEEARKALAAVTYLEDEAVVIDGVPFYGTPWQPEYLYMAFNLPQEGEELQKRWDAIPDDTQVLITHGPPYGVLDNLHAHGPLGCKLLRKRLSWLPELRLHCFGHIHQCYGMNNWLHSRITFVNAALTISDGGKQLRQPIVFDL